VATQPDLCGWTTEASTPTDTDGRFLLSGLYPGWVTIEATHMAGDAAWLAKAIVDVGDDIVALRLPRRPTRRELQLVVKTEDGSHLQCGTWHHVPARGPVGYSDEIALGGDLVRGEVTLPAEPWMQFVMLTDCSWDQARGAIVVGPLGDRGGVLDVVMPKGAQLRGTVRDQFGRPFDDVLLVAYPLYMDGEIEKATAPSPGTTDRARSDGTFRLALAPEARAEIQAHTVKGDVPPLRTGMPSGPLELVGRRMSQVTCQVLHPNGAPARGAIVYARPADMGVGAWQRHATWGDGNVTFLRHMGRSYRLRALMPPSGVEDAAESEILLGDVDEVTLVASGSRALTVRVPGWPRTEPGAASVMNGPLARPHAVWLVAGEARLSGLDARAPLSVYCGPLPDGRIAFRRGIPSSQGEVSLALVASRTIRGTARGMPDAAEPDSVWADTSEFVAQGHVAEDGRFIVRGVPEGTCRVCVVFRLGADRWVGSVQDDGTADRLVVDVKRIAGDALEAWIFPRPGS
jgi:hypothetical protein